MHVRAGSQHSVAMRPECGETQLAAVADSKAVLPRGNWLRHHSSRSLLSGSACACACVSVRLLS